MTARIVDEWRAVFGADTRFPWVREGEVELGTRTAVGRSMDADQWLRFVRTGLLP